ncbi:MAG: exodeoxyribonuclease VII large subunit [Candidatus Omnitrophota bacterium]
MTGPAPRIYTVSELTREIRGILERAFSTVWVEGEVSNFVWHTSGHMYLSLKDSASVIQAAIFKNVNKDIKFNIENGMRVLCLGRLSVYDKRGQYQIYVDRIEPKGIGALQLAFEQLKAKLKKEGLFEAGRKKGIPYLPSRIGVVTSPTGAAVRDIINVTRRRFPNAELILNPVRVQGEGAGLEIAAAISSFNELKNVDVMIVGRGGGSLEDLWPFNEEIVARAIFASDIPVISAVGHEIDWTIADFVADLRAPTPSAAAELVIPRKDELVIKIDNAVERLKQSLRNLVVQAEQEMDEVMASLCLRQEYVIKLKGEEFLTLAGKLESLSPLAVLKRGYSITETVDGGRLVKNAGSVSKGVFLRTRLNIGEIVSRVEDVKSG